MEREEGGYMLTEMLLCIMILGILCLMAAASYNQDFYERRELAMESNAVAYDLRKYQQAARYGSYTTGNLLYMDKKRYGVMNNGRFKRLGTYPSFMEANRRSYLFFSSSGLLGRFSGINPYTLIYKYKGRKWESRVVVALITGRIRIEHGRAE